MSNYLEFEKPLAELEEKIGELRDFSTDNVDFSSDIKKLEKKSDKLKKGPAKSVLLAVEKHLNEAQVNDLVSVQLFSSLKNDGVGQLKQVLNSWLYLDPSEMIVAEPSDTQDPEESSDD